MDARALRFPAGSMYWVKPVVLRMIRGLDLRAEEFEVEQSQLDGTLAHAVERAMGYVAASAGMTIRQTSEIDAAPAAAPEPLPRPAFVSAFYLPRFHRTPETDAWWGRGATDWTAAARARAIYEGHPQPALPSTLGFYDLRVIDVMGEQAALARAAGIDAFCVHHYWFARPDGSLRLMRAPMDALLARPEIDFPFYLCWANEAWRRDGEVLAQHCEVEGFERDLAESVVPFLRDPRYARPDGTRPRLLVQRPEALADPAGTASRLRAALAALGLGPVELGALCPRPGGRPVPEGAFDFWVEMPRHEAPAPEAILHGPSGASRLPVPVPPDFAGVIEDYAAAAARATDPARADALPRDTVAGVAPGWDDTARQGLDARIAYGAHPAALRTWLRGLSRHRLARSYRGEVMIDAWNDWAARAAIEPSERWGHAWLDTLAEWRRAGPGAEAERT